MVGKLLGPEIREMISQRDFTSLRSVFTDWSIPDLAEVLADLEVEEQVIFFRVLPHTTAAETFEYLDVETQTALLHAMGQEQVVGILNEMSADDRTALLEELPANVVSQLLRLLTPKERTVAQTLLNYPEESVGRLMTPDFIAVREDWTISEVLDYIRKHGHASETLNVIYVVDAMGTLVNDVRISEFLIKPVHTVVGSLQGHQITPLKVTALKNDAVVHFKKYDRSAMPVVDSEDKLVGIVTVDDILDVVEEQDTEDIQKLGGMQALDDPYLDVTLFSMVKKRAVWLMVLFLGQTVTASIMGYYENEINTAVVLALFVPLIISSGGNSGSQATTLVIRAMALGEVTLADWWQVMRREIQAGICLGALLGILGLLRITIWSAFSSEYGEHWFLVGLTITFALLGVVIWGTLCGAMLPFLLKKLGLDPATSSAPFVATLVDVTGLVIYFTVAILVLKGTLL